MIIKKILTDPSSDSQDLNKYYEKRENIVKLCNEVPEDQYDTIINISSPPIYSQKVEKNNSIDNRFISMGLVLYEPKKQKYKSLQKT